MTDVTPITERKEAPASPPVTENTSMVMGFIPSDLYHQLRRLATEATMVENTLVSEMVKEGIARRLDGEQPPPKACVCGTKAKG